MNSEDQGAVLQIPERKSKLPAKEKDSSELSAAS